MISLTWNNWTVKPFVWRCMHTIRANTWLLSPRLVRPIKVPSIDEISKKGCRLSIAGAENQQGGHGSPLQGGSQYTTQTFEEDELGEYISVCISGLRLLLVQAHLLCRNQVLGMGTKEPGLGTAVSDWTHAKGCTETAAQYHLNV